MKRQVRGGGPRYASNGLDPSFINAVAAELSEMSFAELSACVDHAQRSLRSGRSAQKGNDPGPPRPLSPEAALIVQDIARTRKEASEKFEMGGALFFTAEGLRWATPEIAARHCAVRLGGQLCMDVTCGQGGQALSLAEVSDRVIAFDIDPLNCLLARANSMAMNIGNMEVHRMDCLSPEALEMAEEGCAVFSDPARPPGSRERTLEEVHPDPRKVVDAYKDHARGLCFELPPYIDHQKIAFFHETEYISLDGRLNRLNVYTGELARDKSSAVVLPKGDSISGARSGPPQMVAQVPFAEGHLFELDPSVVRAGLVGELMNRLGAGTSYLELDDRRSALICDRALSSPFFKGAYRVIGFADTDEGLKGALVETGAGKVTPRYRMDPCSYWAERGRIEEGLEGSVHIHLFRKGSYILTESTELEPGHRS